jgi:hypothetical protein
MIYKAMARFAWVTESYVTKKKQKTLNELQTKTALTGTISWSIWEIFGQNSWSIFKRN